jgi:hypothetical protein
VTRPPNPDAERTLRARLVPTFHDAVEIVVEEVGELGEVRVRVGEPGRASTAAIEARALLAGRALCDARAELDAVAWADLPAGRDERSRDGIDVELDVDAGPARRRVVAACPTPAEQPELLRALDALLRLAERACEGDARALAALAAARRYL